MNTSETERLDIGHDIRTLQDDEWDLVSGGAGRSFAVDIGTSEQLVPGSVARTGFIDASQIYGAL
jgi:hypothetical protein